MCRAENAPLTYFRKVPLLAQLQGYHINDRSGAAVKENRTALCVCLGLKASGRYVCVCVSVSVSVSVGDTYALASLVVQAVKNLPAMQETQVRSLGGKIL